MSKKSTSYLEKNSGNPFDYIRTEEDVELFVQIIESLSTKHLLENKNDYEKQIVLQLLWIITTWIIENVCSTERTINSMLKLLEACIPLTDRIEKNAFDIIMEDCPQESLKEKYEYFKYNTFGIHSNCYKKAVQTSMDVLKETPLDILTETLKTEQIKQTTEIKKEKKLFWGALNKLTGQKLQNRLYELPLNAIHEASHAVAYYLLNVEFNGVTLVSADNALGKVSSKGCKKPGYAKRIIIFYAGLVAEEIIFNPTYMRVWEAGADTQWATKLVKEEIIKELSDQREAQKYIYIDADALGLADNESPYIVYETIKRCKELRQQAIELISSNKEMVKALANELLEKKFMPAEEVVKFLDAWKITNNKILY